MKTVYKNVYMLNENFDPLQMKRPPSQAFPASKSRVRSPNRNGLIREGMDSK